MFDSLQERGINYFCKFLKSLKRIFQKDKDRNIITVKIRNDELRKLIEILSAKQDINNIVEDALEKYFSRLDVKMELCRILLDNSWSERDIIILLRSFGTEWVTRKAIKYTKELEKLLEREIIGRGGEHSE